MDSDNLKVDHGVEVAHQNGGEDGVVANDVNGTFEKITENASLKGDSCVHKSDESVIEGANNNVESNGLSVAKGGEGMDADADSSKHSIPQKGHGKSKNEKPLNSNNVSSTAAKKNKEGKSAEATATSTVSNGFVGLNSHSNPSLKSRSFNDRQVHSSKQSAKSDTPSSEGLVEKTKPKPSKKGPPEKTEKDAEVAVNSEGETKSRRVGSLPNYGFSFRCDERAEKRKEFYSKLEEKIHAKEVEKNNLQAKSKETQEAEIKMLRKSLTFKATPMPSFYQEPAPPKVELKKIPTTKPKSPKLGRRKSATGADSEENSVSCQPPRLSVDGRVPQSNSAKGISPVTLKKPQRKSLPKLPSEKTSLSKSTKEEKHTSLEAGNEESSTSPDATKEVESPTEENGSFPTADPGETEVHTDEVHVAGDQDQAAIV